MAKVWWSSDVPPEVREAAEPIVTAHIGWLPTWAHELVVRWQVEDGDAIAYADSDIGARRARLSLTPSWLNYDEADRTDAIQHEFVHFLLHPLTDWTKSLVEHHMPEELQEWMRSEWQERLEGVTCDVARVLAP